MTEPEQTENPEDGRSRAPDLAQSGGMEVLCAFDERFVPHAATMLCSLLENNRVFRIHLFHSASIDSKKLKSPLAKLKSLIAKYECEMVCYGIRFDDFADLRVDEWSSMAHYFRLLAPRVLPMDINKVLYLDSDLIVRDSLRDLWSIDLSGYALAAVEDAFWAPRQNGPMSRCPKGPDTSIPA